MLVFLVPRFALASFADLLERAAKPADAPAGRIPSAERILEPPVDAEVGIRPQRHMSRVDRSPPLIPSHERGGAVVLGDGGRSLRDRPKGGDDTGPTASFVEELADGQPGLPRLGFIFLFQLEEGRCGVRRRQGRGSLGIMVEEPSSALDLPKVANQLALMIGEGSKPGEKE